MNREWQLFAANLGRVAAVITLLAGVRFLAELEIPAEGLHAERAAVIQHLQAEHRGKTARMVAAWQGGSSALQ